MKRQGILNSDISRVLSYMGHTDTICIGDCGLPIPDETERIDLAVKFGQPSFMDVLEEVGADMKVEKIILAICFAQRSEKNDKNMQGSYSNRRDNALCKYYFTVGLYFLREENSLWKLK